MNTERSVDDALARLDPGEWQPDAARAFANFQTRRMGGNGRIWIWAAGAVLAAGAGVLTFPATRVLAARCVDACEGLFRTSANASSTSAPPIAEAPDFSLKDAQGADLRLSAYRGKVVLLNFWATWCLPCKTEMPWFVEFERADAAQGFIVVAVSMDEKGWGVVWPFLDRLQPNFPVAIGDEALARQYGVNSLPATFLIGRDGRIVARHTGIVAKSDYENEIAKILRK